MIKLLIVDDDLSTVEVLRSAVDFQALGIGRVDVAYNGERAKEMLLSGGQELVLCDIEMPLCSGTELLRWIRERRMDTELIFLSCFEKFEYAREGIEYGAFAYLTKPLELPKLEQTLRRAVDEVARKRELRKRLAGTLPERETPEGPAGATAQARIVETAIAYIREHFREELSRRELAGRIYVSPNYLSKLFSQETGMSIREYANKCRVEEAKRLLTETDRSVSQIGDEVGFDSASYFSTVFLKMTGMKPLQWRNNRVQKQK